METKLKTLREITGKTQGIKFKIKPPINANNMACHKDMPAVDPSSSSIWNPESSMLRMPEKYAISSFKTGIASS